MKRREYRQVRRAEAADATRRRIVDATFALHAAQGIAGTTMTQIAARAGVSVGSVYAHFPTYDDVVAACTAHASAAIAPAGTAGFAACATLADRVRGLVAEIFGFYERAVRFEQIRAEQDRFAALRPFFAAEERQRLTLTRAALAPFAIDGATTDVVAALLDAAVWGSLRRSGLGQSEAIDAITDFLLPRLAAANAASPRRRRTR
ncbi:MAG: TetR/AcrR family transcriptional regulator [Alphaproteobacteria bacterium]|nr:TetR/AcrR family transcriptional regulator [Alphaproteobacteria bacterium]